ncbi:hypothetical protein D9756_003294 [Leucocoprinus leucothites]|uniref:SH3 domain-containing protein n=1 Tax=Leucocoprinus leucothites TaxID=201217 RepID=A0A8H5G6I4_9AGAR|nr:hypothetical protein D9756_003294 [Leucoagaricus leucothites]
MTYTNGSDNSVFLAHIVSQIENNVDFLATQGYISQTDASSFLAKLPRSDSPRNALVPPFPTPTPRSTVPSPAPAPAAPAVPQARALWAWSGQDAGDLTIAQGDVIEIIEETNNDWWTGRLDGRQGIFPASYAEKIQAPAPTNGRPAYKPFRAAYHGIDQPPAVPTPTPGPSERTNSLGLQQAPGQEEKKGKYGDLKKTMANSAAGGVGFGAGAAIGGGLVRAIF